MKFFTISLALVILLTLTCCALTYTNIDFPGAELTSAHGINSVGDIVGNYAVGLAVNGFVLSGGTYTTLVFPTASATWANGINDSGQVVGHFMSSDLTIHGFSYQSGIYSQVDYPSSKFTCVNSINNAGLIVGYYEDSSGHLHGFEDNAGVFLNIDVPRQKFTEAFGLNNNGDIAGFYAAGPEDMFFGFVFHGGRFQKVFVPTAVATVVNAINDTLEVVGNTFKSTRSLAYSKIGSKYTVLDVPGQQGDTHAWGLNNGGFVVGDFIDSGSVEHGFLMTP